MTIDGTFVAVVSGLCFSGALILETIGVWGRYLGAVSGVPVSGYSVHVRLSTIGRGFILISAPLFGWITDMGFGASPLMLSGVVSFSFFIVIVMIDFYFRIALRSGALNWFFSRSDKVETARIPKFSELRFDFYFFFQSMLSFVFVSCGVLVTNILAAHYPDSRAMLVQLSPLVTMTGTLLHVFIIDKKLASAADNVSDGRIADFTQLFLLSRMAGAAILVLVFLSWGFVDGF